MDDDEYDDREFYTLNDLFGIKNNMYPIVYALKICTFRDFFYATVRNAYYVGASVLDGKPTHEVVFFDDFDGEVLTDSEDEFPYNSSPTMGVFIDYESAKEGCKELNAELIEDYKKSHFDYEINDALEELKRSEEHEDKTVYKDINKDRKNTHIFSTVYVKTKFPN